MSKFSMLCGNAFGPGVSAPSRILALSTPAIFSLVLGVTAASAQSAVTHSPPSEKAGQGSVVDPNFRKSEGTTIDPNIRKSQGAIIDPNNHKAQGSLIDPNERKVIDPNVRNGQAGTERKGIIANDRK